MNTKKSTAAFLLQLTAMALLSVLMAPSGCSPKHNPSPKEVAQQRLTSGTWLLDNLQIDNVDQTSLFTGLTLKFTTSNYSTTNGQAIVWPSSGTWAFKDDKGTSILRDGNLEIAIRDLTQNKLTISFTMTTTYGGGRTGTVGGNYVFTFKK